METFLIEPGPKTPHVLLDQAGYIELKGKSIPENSVQFYKQIFDWLDNYSANPKESTKVLVQLEYFNTSSSKCILDIFRIMESLHNSGRSKVTIAWLYDEEDEDMMETGEDYQTIVKIPFTISKIQ